MRTNFPTARRHLEEAHRLLLGEDELTVKSRQALEILIDALLAMEFSADASGNRVIDLSEARKRLQDRCSEKIVPVA